VQQGDFVYEWGRSETVLLDGKKMGGRFLTVWERQPDGGWKILRNVGIPGDLRHIGSGTNDVGTH
jgi:ketosteroid isomerase-like protein